MLTSALQTKWIMRLMVLTYLLLSFGTADATFWCQADEGFTHLESNPIGKCWINCSSNSESSHQILKIPPAVEFSSSSEGDCFDSPVYSSVIPTSNRINFLNQKLVSSFSTIHLPHFSELNLEISRLASRNLSGFISESQTLKVLRTVVLLR